MGKKVCNRTPNSTCVVCGKPIYVRPYRLNKKNHGFTCSLKCSSKNRSVWFSGAGNHQYGLKEDLNASFKHWKKLNSFGYVLVHKKDHPFCDKSGMVFEHRLVVEDNADKFDEKFFVCIGGKKYLKKEYSVHHKNEVRTDNSIENLMVLTKAEHRRLHNAEREIIRNRKGLILDSIKNGSPIPIKIKLFGNGKVPVRKTSGAACFDCFANKSLVIKKGSREKVPLGFGLELPYLFEAVIRPRSGLTLKGIDSAIGTIDEDFRAEISAVVINNSDNDFEVKEGDRICQLAIRRYDKIGFDIKKSLNNTERGADGFGSTGTR